MLLRVTQKENTATSCCFRLLCWEMPNVRHFYSFDGVVVGAGKEGLADLVYIPT